MNICIGCACKYTGSISRYCSLCESKTCTDCGMMGVSCKICIQCRRGNKMTTKNSSNSRKDLHIEKGVI